MSRQRHDRNSRSDRERALLERSRLLPAVVRSASYDPSYAMVVESAVGARIRDCSGNEYIDYLLGSGPMFLGHAHPSVLEAVRGQLEKGSSYLMVNEPAICLAEEIVAAVPCAEQVTFHSSGSEATFFALRLARAFRGRDKILKFEGGYHGMHDAALMSTQWTTQPVDYPGAVPNSAGIPERARQEVLVAPFNDIERSASIIRAHSEELACVIVEPLHRTIPPREGFLQELRALTLELEIPLIFDEVVTGFRLALGGAQELYGVTPDLCASGKALSGGHPFGVVCGVEELMSHAKPERILDGSYVRLTGTFSSNPISCAAALAILQELKKPGFFETVNQKGRRLQQALSDQLEASRLPAQVCGEATVFQPWFTRERLVDHRSALTADPASSAKFVDLLLDRGIIKGHEKFFVSAAHDDEDIDLTIEAFREVIPALEEYSFPSG